MSYTFKRYNNHGIEFIWSYYDLQQASRAIHSINPRDMSPDEIADYIVLTTMEIVADNKSPTGYCGTGGWYTVFTNHGDNTCSCNVLIMPFCVIKYVEENSA